MTGGDECTGEYSMRHRDRALIVLPRQPEFPFHAVGRRRPQRLQRTLILTQPSQRAPDTPCWVGPEYKVGKHFLEPDKYPSNAVLRIVEDARACRPCASITFASLSSVTSASLSAASTNAFDPASSAPAQVLLESYQTLMQSPDVPLEYVCLLIPRLL